MTMVTRCPSCATLFRVTPQQLQTRDGQVRCGRCMTVFDGFKGLGTLPDQGAPETAPEPANAGSSVNNETWTAAADAGVSGGLAQTPAPESAPVPAVPVGFEFKPWGPRAAPAPEPSFEPPVKPAAVVSASSKTAISPLSAIKGDELFLEQARSARRRGSRIWTAGSALMLLALAAQAAYFYRGELAANYPGLKPLVLQICDLLQCSVPLPQRPRLINIEASDLQNVDPARPGVIRLTATLRNHASYDLGYPALDLVLTNTKEHTLARRIFLPEEYLHEGRDMTAGFPANAEITIRLDLDTGDLGAVGFRLDLLPTPVR